MLVTFNELEWDYLPTYHPNASVSPEIFKNLHFQKKQHAIILTRIKIRVEGTY